MPLNRFRYVIVGAGIHGLSTAYHLALELKARGKGDGSDIVVVDKSTVGAGASGIACGVIRNNYFQPAMRELMVHSVEAWESDPQSYSYHPVGYMQIAPEAMQEDVASIARQQQDIDYESVFVSGEKDCTDYMKGFFSDWQAQGVSCILHEKRGGYANNMKSMHGLAAKVKSVDVQILERTGVTGFERDSGSGTVTAVNTSKGRIECDYAVVALGPWVKIAWEMLDLPKEVKIQKNGEIRKLPMWVYWCLQEGTLGVEPGYLKTNAGELPPVVHIDSTASLYSDSDGSLISDKMWGIYYKPDFEFGGVQGGTSPYLIEADPDAVNVDPYGPASPDYVVDDKFVNMWVSALAHCQKRFEGTLPKYRNEPSGGIGAFTPDSFPVFDVFRNNCYVIADSNHGYKMLGVGKLVAKEICGDKSRLLEPFRFSRYATGELHPRSNSPFPWS